MIQKLKIIFCLFLCININRIKAISKRKNEYLYSSIFKNIKSLINEYNVISFDLFDTLLIRPYSKPKDLFKHLEKLYNSTGFAEKRIEAEIFARKKYHNIKEEITFDEIYMQIDLKYQFLKEKELELEYNSLKPRLYIKNIYEYAIQQNKTIIMTSDMYFSKTFLEKVLKKCGYNIFKKLYISSEYGISKKSGSIYYMILKDLDISKNDILHIGDNLNSDVHQAYKVGINGFHIPKAIELLFEADPRLKNFYKNYKNDLGASIILGLLSLHFENSYKNYWYELGYKYAGPIIFGYMQWLEQQLKKDEINRVLFVARDGYTLEKVFNLIKTTNILSHYIYFPRKIAKECLKGNPEKTKKEYLIYLKQFNIEDKKIAIVDSITHKWTSQKGLISLFPEKYVKGYYWFVRKSKFENLKFEFYQKDHKHRIGDLIELFMTAPTPPIKTIIDGNPVFNDIERPEQIRMNLYPDLSDGAIDFARDFISHFEKVNGFFSSEMLINFVNILLYSPTEIDKTMFFNIEHASFSNHSNYHKLFNHWYYFNNKKNKKINEKNYKKALR